ncbi:50S ribosomal protein L10 [Candidatus Azambacteria bacterium]|nr:50S ribosomal protein L10 [Candidatus Azambacteria bacterium]
MPVTKQQKQEIMIDLEKKLNGFKAIVFSDFTGISVEKFRELRRELKKAGVYLKVSKKNIVGIILNKLGFKVTEEGRPLEKKFKGSASLAVSYNNELTVAQILHKFSKKNSTIKIIGGIVDNKIMTAEEMIVLAKLPSREELIMKLMFTLKFPLTKLAMTLNEVSKKKVA